MKIEKYLIDSRKYHEDIDGLRAIAVLAHGNCFMRDWCNVLLESDLADSLEISYLPETDPITTIKSRAEEADIIFVTEIEVGDFRRLDIPRDKVWYVGTKNFGVNNGLFYNYSGQDYCGQRTPMETGYLLKNEQLQRDWGHKYIDMISPVLDANNEVPVFTPNCMFISQDCRHFTKAGAQYYAALLSTFLEELFSTTSSF